jgi:hypothetical protein
MVDTNRGLRNNVRRIAAACASGVLNCTLVCAFGAQGATEMAMRARIRSTDARMLELIQEGRERSNTFDELAAAIDRSTGIVYVEFGYCAFGHLNGCLLPFIARTEGERYLRIVVSPDKNQRTHNQLLALMAHELQHAREVIAHEEVVDAPTMQAMFRKIGAPVKHGYETPAAQAMGDKVLAELAGRATRP